MLRIFASGIAANITFVASGLLKQYLIAGSLSVSDFGTYGSLVAFASLLLMLLPFPAYLDVMIRGFSASPRAFGTRKRLLRAVRSEMLALAATVTTGLGLLAAHAVLAKEPDHRVLPLLLLLLVQYLTVSLDLLLRMFQAHRRIAVFMVVRNLPALAMLVTWGANSPLQVALVDLTTAILVTGSFLHLAPLHVRASWTLRRTRWQLGGEQTTLWLARLAQFGNSSVLRLLVPMTYAAHDIGLFFFALTAQLPCSLFLSVTTQLYGHTLARLPRGDWATLWRTQVLFVLPNLLYVLAATVGLQFWGSAIAQVPKLAKYADAGPLVLAVVVYGSVLASDCQEYLLRARGLSRVLLACATTSIIAQLVSLAVAAALHQSLRDTLFACATVQAVVLACFSIYSFRRVVGQPALEPVS